MPAALALDPRHQERQHDAAAGETTIVELPVVRGGTERRLARIGEEYPAFGARAFDRRFLGSAHVVILSVGLTARIQYGNAPVNIVAIALVDQLQRLMAVDDALNRAPQSTDELHLQILAQIRDNLTLQGKLLTDQGKLLTDQGRTIGDMNGRLIRVEERDTRVAELQDSYRALDAKVDALLRDKDERAGAKQVFVGIRGWIPVIIAIGAAIASIFSAIYLSGQAAGIISPPPNRDLERAVGEIERGNGRSTHP